MSHPPRVSRLGQEDYISPALASCFLLQGFEMESILNIHSSAVHLGVNAADLKSPNASREERLTKMQSFCCDIPPCEKRFSHGEGNVLRCVACEVGFVACLPCSVTQPLPCPKCQLPLESGAAASLAMRCKDDA